MPGGIAFKSYCWAIGTTSYRTDKFNMNIELQLKLLKEFWKLPENSGLKWTGNNELQKRYYEFLQKSDFVKGNAPRPDKDAREKTSGLRDIGLLTDERKLTPAGEALLKIANENDFSSDNSLEISRDSYIYFKQLLKTHNNVEGKIVRPFVVFLYVVSKTNYLTYDEFTYLLPLCVDRETTEKVIELILDSRKGAVRYEEAILSILLGMENYKQALQMFQEEPIQRN